LANTFFFAVPATGELSFFLTTNQPPHPSSSSTLPLLLSPNSTMAHNDSSYYNQRQRTYSGDNYYAANPPHNDNNYYAANHPPPGRDYNEGYHTGYSNQHRDSYNDDYRDGSNKQQVYEEDDNYYHHTQQVQQPYDGRRYDGGTRYDSQPQHKYDMTQPRSAPQPPPQRYDPHPSTYDPNPSAYNDYHDQSGYAGAPTTDRNPYPVHDDYRSTTPVSHAPSDYYRNNSSANLGTPRTDTDDPAYPAPLASTVNRNSGFIKFNHQNLDEDDAPQKPVKRSCLDYLCCGCCLCLPKWLRWICCFLLLILIALAIAIGVLVATFKTPTVNYLGTSQSSDGIPQFTVNGTSWSIFTQLNIQVINPNIESITFSNVKAVAYYPTTAGENPRPSIGGGQLASLKIDAKATTNITFPFQITYNPQQDTDQAVLTDIATKCGLLGGQKTPLTVDYDLTLSLKILFITISPTISETATFDCPIQ
ncbi:hypothetical protein BC937DRAFT_86898, partial [Endogone sp. FLAS-F59071]